MGRKSKVAERRKEILEHFYMVIIEEGFERASIARIAKRMQVNPSLLIHYFSTKEEMIKGLIDSILTHYQQQFLPALESTTDPKARFQLVLKSLTNTLRKETDDAVYYSCYALLFRDPEIKSRFKEVYKQIGSILTAELIRANEAGVIEVKDPKVAAYVLIWMAEGMSFYGNIFDEVSPWEEGTEVLKSYLAASI